MTLPESMTEDDRACRAGPIVVGSERTAESRRDAEGIEQVGRDVRAREPLRGSLSQHVHRAVGVRRQAGERVAHVLPVAEVGGRHFELRIATERLIFPDAHEPIGLVEGERPQQHVVRHRECRRRGANPERAHSDGRERKRRGAAEEPPRVVQVLPQHVPLHMARVVDDVGDGRDPESRGSCRACDVAPPAADIAPQLVTVLDAERRRIEIEQQTIDAQHHRRSGRKPLARASLRRDVRRPVSARATAVPNGVMR